ncbi:NRDE protein-domain-containing protein [Aspergillus pseudotamarii]|uniref:NRDE protein-domain-containing protein n=1 Tax=Aspergillus pseudotamarii TaxID=132259 RepID=A0A5N6T9U8_ASPPS|nr:NRDE protein-domain-containing protein [Aspergillus pseudotamarii]KAE8143060.1 NRDE protein-domain-containing protein [Aspergillus pseudotamarii]
MCIAFFSTAHPQYRLIICNNRDEFLHRPTSRADWWPSPHSHVLSARDLVRPIHPTWLGITKQGRIAVLTNYHEDTCAKAVGKYSRGEVVNSWLTSSPDSAQTTQEFVNQWTTNGELTNIGGFNLVCGNVMEPLAILASRASETEPILWVADKPGQTVGLSNTDYEDRSWPKVEKGEDALVDAIAGHVQHQESEDDLIERLLGVLSVDTLPRLSNDAGVQEYIPHLPRSVFIPPIGRDTQARDEAELPAKQDKREESPVLPSTPEGTPNRAYLEGLYATQKQTVILVGFDGRVRFFERTLYDDDARPVSTEARDRSFEFRIEK